MKRDMDLVRRILIEAERLPDDDPMAAIRGIGGVSDTVFARHVALMQQAGLVQAPMERGGGRMRELGTVRGLTWDGYDFLDAVRSDSIWAKTQSAIASAAGSVPFDLLKAVAMSLLQSKLGIGSS